MCNLGIFILFVVLLEIGVIIKILERDIVNGGSEDLINFKLVF